MGSPPVDPEEAEMSMQNVTYLPGAFEAPERFLDDQKDTIFEQEPTGDPASLVEVGQSVVLDSAVNRSLRLAQQYDFLSMARRALWGDEDRTLVQEFGWMLRGAIETFRPRNAFELHILSNVVEAQWRLIRISKMQKAIFEGEAKTGAIGKHGLPAATTAARTLDSDYRAASELLDKTIQAYRRMALTRSI